MASRRSSALALLACLLCPLAGAISTKRPCAGAQPCDRPWKISGRPPSTRAGPQLEVPLRAPGGSPAAERRPDAGRWQLPEFALFVRRSRQVELPGHSFLRYDFEINATGSAAAEGPNWSNVTGASEEGLAVAWGPDQTDVIYVAPAGMIGLVYACLFLPLGAAWAAARHFGKLEKSLALLLPLTLVALIIGFDVANQSLSVFMRAPMAITSLHAFFLGLLMNVWVLVTEFQRILTLSLRPLRYWCAVMALFAVYQMCNHLVSYYCSLSERIVFSNLCPVLSLVLEMVVMPWNKKPQVSRNCKIALACMALGAGVFSSQKADFTKQGFLAASTLVIMLVPYRVTQRWVITCHCQDFPPALLAALDGYALFLPSILVSESALTHNGQAPVAQWVGWLENDSILLLAILTVVTFVLTHLCGILLMRVGTATSYIVFANLANFILVALSFVLFHENVVESGLMFAGLMISLVSGTWYATEANMSSSKKPVDKAEDARTPKNQGKHWEVSNAEGMLSSFRGKQPVDKVVDVRAPQSQGEHREVSNAEVLLPSFRGA